MTSACRGDLRLSPFFVHRAPDLGRVALMPAPVAASIPAAVSERGHVFRLISRIFVRLFVRDQFPVMVFQTPAGVRVLQRVLSVRRVVEVRLVRVDVVRVVSVMRVMVRLGRRLHLAPVADDPHHRAVAAAALRAAVLDVGFFVQSSRQVRVASFRRCGEGGLGNVVETVSWFLNLRCVSEDFFVVGHCFREQVVLQLLLMLLLLLKLKLLLMIMQFLFE
jgi:hypothetical protein